LCALPLPRCQPPSAMLSSVESDRIVFDDRVRQKLVTHRPEVGFGLGPIRAIELEVEDLPLTDMSDTIEAQTVERSFDRLSLLIENAVLQRHRHSCLDHFLSPVAYFTRTGPVPRIGSFSLMMPSRRATSE